MAVINALDGNNICLMKNTFSKTETNLIRRLALLYISAVLFNASLGETAGFCILPVAICSLVEADEKYLASHRYVAGKGRAL